MQNVLALQCKCPGLLSSPSHFMDDRDTQEMLYIPKHLSWPLLSITFFIYFLFGNDNDDKVWCRHDL